APGQDNVSKNTAIEAVFSVPLDDKHIKKNDVKLRCLSCKSKRRVKGVVSYVEEERRVVFTPRQLLAPGVYEIEYKHFKAKKSASKEKKRCLDDHISKPHHDKKYRGNDEENHKLHIKEIKYRFKVLNKVMQTITIAPDLIELKEGGSLQLHATGHYDTGVEKEITAEVQWSTADGQLATIDANATLRALKEGTTTITAKLGNVESSTEVTVYWEVNGHRLPPEPDKALNDSTLLGIDVNHNGVRDDVERYIYTKYDTYVPCHQELDYNNTVTIDGEVIPSAVEVCEENPIPYHPIVRAIAMQGARATQIIIQEPERAKETMQYFRSANFCDMFFSRSDAPKRKYNGKEYIIGMEVMSEKNGLINIFFNTILRARAYAKYNFYLSGGVYFSPTRDEAFNMCSEEVKKLYKGL
ncbi:MAG: Ig-like domain-containing protein, partial [Sulfurimonas sp.]